MPEMTEKIICGDCLPIIRAMPANSVDAIITDPPYFKVKGAAWDHQWDKPEGFIKWIGELVDAWERILKPNGSLYVFASPNMAGRVEMEIARRFEVLNHIIWLKHDGFGNGMHSRQDPEILRSWFPQTERILFAEHKGADNIAKGEAGYIAKCDELRGFIFEPIRKYLADEMERAGFDKARVNLEWRKWKGGVGGMASHWFTTSQWAMPTAENYAWLQSIFNKPGALAKPHAALQSEYKKLFKEYDVLRRDYEELKKEFEALRRPFSVTDDSQYTDVWNFATVGTYPGKHPAEKPLQLMEHIIRASTLPGAVVLDCFAGSGTTLEAAKLLGRGFIGIDKDAHWCEVSRRATKHAGTNAKAAPGVAMARAVAEYKRTLKGKTCAKK